MALCLVLVALVLGGQSMEAGPDEADSTVRVLLLKDAPEQGADDPYRAALAARLAGPGSALSLRLEYQALQQLLKEEKSNKEDEEGGKSGKEDERNKLYPPE